MSEETIRAVVDTQIFLRAAINRRSIPGKIVFDLKGQYQLITSEQISAEVADVLNRPKIRAKFKTITDDITRGLLNILENAVQITVEEVPAIARDPKDDIFLACASVGQADYIVSEDKDLLTLHPYEAIKIVNALEFLHILQPPEASPDDETP